MKLINKNEEAPEYYYIFLNFDNGITGFVHKHNFELDHKLRSGFVHNLGLDNKYIERYMNGTQKYIVTNQNENDELPKSPTSFLLGCTDNYGLEHNIEIYRYNNVGVYPSRFSALFAFGDYETCKVVSDKYGWDLEEVRKFKLCSDGALKPFYRVSKHNMEIISALRAIDMNSVSVKEQDSIYKQYWNGDARGNLVINGETYNIGEIYEYLIEGTLEMVE